VRSDELTYTYITNCVYLHEHERGSIKDEELLDHGLHLHAVCGEFSYALLPSTTAYSRNVPAFYEFILGVTGTLQEGRLPKEARDVLRDEIKIKHMTFCPSMYGGAVTRAWNPVSKAHVILTSQEQYFVMITNEIEKRLQPTDSSFKGQRAALVFFESITELEAYYNSSYFRQKSFASSAQRLTETSAREPEVTASAQTPVLPWPLPLTAAPGCCQLWLLLCG
jgi:hypothetical protein